MNDTDKHHDTWPDMPAGIGSKTPITEWPAKTGFESNREITKWPEMPGFDSKREPT